MKPATTILLATLLALPLSAMAGDCDADIAQVDAQFTSTNPLPIETLSEARRLRKEAGTHCEAGEVSTGLDLLTQAKQLLGIQ